MLKKLFNLKYLKANSKYIIISESLMNSFISYSHQDNQMLEMLHKHLANLQREGLITTWTDREILAGGKFERDISSALNSSNLFIALLSPDYIASNYCYEKEFQKALEMQEQGKIIIIPIIAEPCDWLSTPFKDFKALPKDGKAVSTWENKNTAFLDVIQNIRKLITSPANKTAQTKLKPSPTSSSRNYRVQKDFDSIEKMEFVEKTFHEVREFLKRYIEEIIQMENIKARILVENNKEFECLLVNRNKIATESQLKLSINNEKSGFPSFNSNEMQITYSISSNNRPSHKNFSLSLDQYHLFWVESNFYSSSRTMKELESKNIADIIWNEWLESVGIM